MSDVHQLCHARQRSLQSALLPCLLAVLCTERNVEQCVRPKRLDHVKSVCVRAAKRYRKTQRTAPSLFRRDWSAA